MTEQFKNIGYSAYCKDSSADSRECDATLYMRTPAETQNQITLKPNSVLFGRAVLQLKTGGDEMHGVRNEAR